MICGPPITQDHTYYIFVRIMKGSTDTCGIQKATEKDILLIIEPNMLSYESCIGFQEHFLVTLTVPSALCWFSTRFPIVAKFSVPNTIKIERNENGSSLTFCLCKFDRNAFSQWHFVLERLQMPSASSRTSVNNYKVYSSTYFANFDKSLYHLLVNLTKDGLIFDNCLCNHRLALKRFTHLETLCDSTDFCHEYARVRLHQKHLGSEHLQPNGLQSKLYPILFMHKTFCHETSSDVKRTNIDSVGSAVPFHCMGIPFLLSEINRNSGTSSRLNFSSCTNLGLIHLEPNIHPNFGWSGQLVVPLIPTRKQNIEVSNTKIQKTGMASKVCCDTRSLKVCEKIKLEKLEIQALIGPDARQIKKISEETSCRITLVPVTSDMLNSNTRSWRSLHTLRLFGAPSQVNRARNQLRRALLIFHSST